MLFVNNGNPSSILLRIGEGCATNCYNCYSRYDRESYYSYDSFLKTIEFLDKKFDKSFSVFLFGVEVIFHPEIEKFIEDKIILKYRHSLHINPMYSEIRIKRMLELSNKYNYIYFDTCFTIKNIEEFISVFKTISFLKNNKINSSMDLFLDFEKFGLFIKKFFSDNGFIYRKQEQTSHLNYPDCLEFTANDKKIAIMIYHTKRQEIQNKRITNIPNTGCVVRKSFGIIDKSIIVNEEVELDNKGIIKVHINTYCNKAIKKISDIDKKNNEIIDDFIKLDNYLSKYDRDDMGRDCFTCISNPYINL